MDFGFKQWMSLLLGAVLVLIGILPIYSIDLIPLQGMPRTIVLILALLFLIVDGFGEEHALKTITLVFGLIMAIYVAVPLLYTAGWLPFTLPGAILPFEGWIIGISGVFLLFGAFKGS